MKINSQLGRRFCELLCSARFDEARALLAGAHLVSGITRPEYDRGLVIVDKRQGQNYARCEIADAAQPIAA